MVATLFVIAAIFAACLIVAAIDEAWDTRQKRRRIERLRERRRHLNSVQPKRWTT